MIPVGGWHVRVSMLMFACASLWAADPLQQVGSVTLTGVHGRIDHMAFDPEGNRLFVAALGNDSIEVVDVKAGKVVRSIPAMHEPQGLAWIPASRTLAAASRGDGILRLFDGQWKWRSVKLGDDADNVRWDARGGRIFVGYGEGGLAMIDAARGVRAGDVPLGGHPESFQIEAQGSRIFVNVPPKTVAVVDRESGKVTAKWSLTAVANYPMALDESGQRLFIGCRSPARLIVLNTQTGQQVASVPVAGDTDDLFYDAGAKRVYVIGGAGMVDVIAQADRDRYERVSEVHTAAGARTGLFVPGLKRLYVAVPHRGAQQAEIRIFATE